MKKMLGIVALVASFGFGQEVVLKDNINFQTNVNSKKLIDLERVMFDFCVDGLLYRGFEANGSYMTSKTVLDPASFHQVIGADGKPMTCKIESKDKK